MFVINEKSFDTQVVLTRLSFSSVYYYCLSIDIVSWLGLRSYNILFTSVYLKLYLPCLGHIL